MSHYKPDNWVILHIKSDDAEIYKVLAGWSGGYLDGDSWKLNSGIVGIYDNTVDNCFDVVGHSGSVYHLHKEACRVSMATSGVLDAFMNRDDLEVNIIPFEDIEGLEFFHVSTTS